MESPAARVGALSRNPAGIRAVRHVRDELGVDVELVMMDTSRAIVVAGLSDITLLPRPVTQAERLMIESPNELQAVATDSYAVRVPLEPDELVLLSATSALNESQMDHLGATAKALSRILLRPLASNATSLMGDRDPIEILASQRDVIVVIDDDLVIRYCNNAVSLVFGWLADELVGSLATDFAHPDDMKKLVSAISQLMHADEIYRVRIRFLNASGGWTPVSATAIDQTHNPKVRGVTVSMRPADYENEAARTLQVLEERASTDQLTGLSNRQSLIDALKTMASRWTRLAAPGPIAASFIGFDGFKAINDVHGHRAGDQALQIAATRLRSVVAEADLVARVGGDEFVVIESDPGSIENAERTAGRIHALLSEPYEIGDNRLHLTVSVGVAIQDDDRLSTDDLLQNAGIAVFAAKEQGRNRVVRFDDDLAIASALAETQRAMVRSALDHERIQMHYQPIVKVDGTILGFEALARCFDIQGKLHMPGEFIPATSGTSLAVKLDREGFRQSCELASSLQDAWPNAGLFVSCNFSANSLSQTDFVENVLATLLRSGADPSTLCVEITESAAFEAGPASIEGLEKLYGTGVRIALDDFGTGYSSLSHLRDLPLSTVKIDQSFVEALSVAGPERTITQAITGLAQALGFAITAEGVETVEQLEAASQMGIEQLQGWYFDKALTLEQLHERLAAQAG